jgi:hypothetical protein
MVETQAIEKRDRGVCPEKRNKMIDTITIKWDLLGARLATLSDEEQSEFFRGFAFELGQYETAYKREMQMLSIRDKLTKDERKILEESLPCLWFDNKE